MFKTKVELCKKQLPNIRFGIWKFVIENYATNVLKVNFLQSAKNKLHESAKIGFLVHTSAL